MVYKYDSAMTKEGLIALLEHIKSNRTKTGKQNFMEFFGALPDIGDGLEYQKNARNEWD